MGMKIKYLGGRRLGDFEVDPNTAAYVAGQPLQVNSSGQLTLNTNGYQQGGGATYNHVGLALGHSGSTSDQYSDIYNGRAGVLVGAGNVVELNADDPENPNDALPYDDTLTYNEGDDIYIDTTGKLSNATPGGSGSAVPAGSDPIAYVLVAPTSSQNMVIVTVR